MIAVNRKKVKVPDVLMDKDKVGVKETKANIIHANKGNWDNLKYSAYTHVDVKEALIELFNEKCAYCESKFLHVYPGDIEHFRPKGKIEEATPKQTPGYYWLAADWNNLLLACRNCNQNLKHLVFGSMKRETLGKMNQFPLSKGFKHVQSHKNAKKKLEEEEKYRLIINPCIENPEKHFEYNNIGVIKPKFTTGRKFEMANKSILVYALQRMPLVQNREKVLIEIYAQIQRVIEATKNLDESMTSSGSKDKRVLYDKILKREIVKLKKFTNDEEEYAGMARQIINDFMIKHFGTKASS